MCNVRKFGDFDLTVVTLDEIFGTVQLQTLNSIHLTTTTINNIITFDSDCKRYFLHFLIKEVCEVMRTITDKNKALLVNPRFMLTDYEIWNYMDRREVARFVYSSFDTLKEHLPFPVLCCFDNIDLDERTGETIDVLNILSMLTAAHSIKPITTKKLKEFSKKNGLTYLTNTYYVSSEFKKLLYGSQ